MSEIDFTESRNQISDATKDILEQTANSKHELFIALSETKLEWGGVHGQAEGSG